MDLVELDKLQADLLVCSDEEKTKILIHIETTITQTQEIIKKYAGVYNKFKSQKSIVDILRSKKIKKEDNKIKTINIPNLSYLPNTSMYWVENIKQYAIKINNITFRGGIGNIYPTANRNSVNIKNCRNGKNCRDILRGKCNFYHDPADFVGVSRINPIRNYTQASWVFTTQSDNASNKYMRRIGNRSTFDSDIMILRSRTDAKELCDIYKSQTTHDLLISLLI
jgi:hypothetical protein